VLVIDHLMPVSKGGTNDRDNLITACESCNQGKSDRLLDSTIPPTDADFRYLAVMQEKAELERASKAFDSLHKLRQEVAEQLQDMAWEVSEERSCPPLANITQMLVNYDFEIVAESIKVAATAVANGRVKSGEMMRYAGGVARKRSEESSGS
jgi:hypothetical protein